MKRIKVIIAIVVVVALIAVGVFVSQKRKPKKEVIKIGILYPLTGDASYWGENARDGALLAVKLFSAKKFLKGYHILPIVVDSKSEPKSAVSGVKKLIYKDQVKFLVGDLASSNLLAILPIVNKNKILCIGQGSSPLIKKVDYVFRTFPSDDYQGLVLSEFIKNFIKVDPNDVSIIYINNDYGEGIKRILTEKLGGRFRLIESYSPGKKDFKDLIPKVLNSKVMVIIGYPQEVPIFLKQLNEFGFKGKVIGTETFDNEAIQRLSLNYSVFYSVPKFGEANDPVVLTFKKNFEKHYNRSPGMPADMAFDAMMLVLKGIDSVGYDPVKVRDYLYSLKNYKGASGIITFDKYGDVIKPFFIKSIRNKKVEIVWEWRPKK